MFIDLDCPLTVRLLITTGMDSAGRGGNGEYGGVSREVHREAIEQYVKPSDWERMRVIECPAVDALLGM